MILRHYTVVPNQGMTRRIPASQRPSIDVCGTAEYDKREGRTGESRIDPTKLIFILKINKFPICFIISLLGNPILPVSDRLLGISFVCSMVLLMSSSKSEILTD
jgi:hypothetical protein